MEAADAQLLYDFLRMPTSPPPTKADAILVLGSNDVRVAKRAAELHATGLAACENSPCCMNNADGVEEMLTTSMLLCPGCLRKLQLIGAMPNVSGGLRSLRERLAAEGPGFEDDLQTLEEWGVAA